MTDIAIRRLEFARGEGEALSTGRVRLDASGPEYNLFLLWMPQQAPTRARGEPTYEHGPAFRAFDSATARGDK